MQMSFPNPRNVTLNTFSTLIFSQLSHIKGAGPRGTPSLFVFCPLRLCLFLLFISTTCSEALPIKLLYAGECGVASPSVHTTLVLYNFDLYGRSLAVMLPPPPTEGRGHSFYSGLYVSTPSGPMIPAHSSTCLQRGTRLHPSLRQLLSELFPG